jgi:hypothetical protein
MPRIPTYKRVDGTFRDTKTGRLYPAVPGVPSLCAGVEQDGTGITRTIQTFLEKYPFPNYEGLQSFGDLVVRGQENPFAKGLLGAIGYNKLVLECGSARDSFLITQREPCAWRHSTGTMCLASICHCPACGRQSISSFFAKFRARHSCR